MNISAIVYIVIAALAVFAAYHFHLLATVEAAIKKHFHSSATAGAAGGGVIANNGGSSAAPPASGSTSSAPPVVTAPGAKLPEGIDTPDANGFVALTGIPQTSARAKIRFSIAEVGAALPGVQHASVALNSGFLANGRWIASNKFIGVCAQIEAVTDGTTGAQTYRLKTPEQDIPNTLALPPHFTVASATAYFASLPEPHEGDGAGFLPPSSANKSPTAAK